MRPAVEYRGDLNPEVRVEAGRFVVRFDHRVVSSDRVPERASAGWTPPDWRVQRFELVLAADGSVLSPRKAISPPRTEDCRGIGVGVLGNAALVAYEEMGAIRTAFVERIPALD